MKHRITHIQQIYTLVCAKCNNEWEEKSQCELCNAYPIGISTDDWLECPKCKEELRVDNLKFWSEQ